MNAYVTQGVLDTLNLAGITVDWTNATQVELFNAILDMSVKLHYLRNLVIPHQAYDCKSNCVNYLEAAIGETYGLLDAMVRS